MTDQNKEPDPQNVEVLKHEGYRWVYDKTHEEQGAYSLSDPDRNIVAVIFPFDRARAIDAPGKNARLLIRHNGSDDWYESGPYTLPAALEEGNGHADLYRYEMKVHAITKQAGRCQRDNARAPDSPNPGAKPKVPRRPRRRNRGQDRDM